MTIKGTGSDNDILTSNGNDIINSGAGNDTIYTSDGNDILQLWGTSGAVNQVFELDDKINTLRFRQGGEVLIKSGNTTGSKNLGGLFIERQDGHVSNGRAVQLTVQSGGPRLFNTSFGSTGTHGTFKFINGGNLDNSIDTNEHVVAEFGPTSSAHFTFHVPVIANSITASSDISASGNLFADLPDNETDNNIATYNNAAPSISFGKLVAKGEKNKHAKNRTPITSDVIPVLPPAFTPAPDST